MGDRGLRRDERLSTRALLCSCACVALAAALATSCGEARRDRPGIEPRLVLLVTVDGLRADHVSAWNYPRPTTDIEVGLSPLEARPLSIDRLAEEGVMFAHAFAPSTECRASLAAVHSGRSPLASEARRDGELALDDVTLAESFASAGFDTRAFVSSGGTELGPGWEQGFAELARCASDLDAVQRVLAWISGHDFGSGGRAFVWLHLSGPAFPYEPGNLADIDFARLFADPAYSGIARADAAFRDEGVALSDADRAHVEALHDGEIARTTHLLRRLLDWLDFTGAPADAWAGTLLAFAGLGGESLPRTSSRELGDRSSPSEGALHVPLFVRHPDSLTGRRIFASLVTLEDLYPTLLEWYALPLPDDLDGSSLLSLTDEWRHRSFPERDFVGAGSRDATGASALSVRDERWRLVVSRPPSPEDGGGARLELHDLARDPRARVDVASEHPEIVERLRARLPAWLR